MKFGHTQPSITPLLVRLNQGEMQAWNDLAPQVQQDIRRLARWVLRSQAPVATMQPTMLVNELFLRLLRSPNTNFKDSNHFFALATRIMRSLLIDHMRQQFTIKRAGLQPPFLQHSIAGLRDSRAVDNLREGLDELERLSPRQAHIVDLRFFIGLSIDEIAAELNISSRTVKRDWEVARLWLLDYISNSATK